MGQSRCIVIALMVGVEVVPETIVLNELTWLVAQEDFITVICRESFTSYTRNAHVKCNLFLD